MDRAVAPWREALAPTIAATPWIIAMDVMAPAARLARELLALGAPDVFVLTTNPGTGLVELPPGVQSRCIPAAGANMMEGIRAAQRALDQVPQEVQHAVDAWDPQGRARVVRPFFSDGRPVAGRPCFGARPRAWQALEDKTVVDGVFAAAGVPTAPWEVVRPELAELTGAIERVGTPAGAVLGGDSREGFNGGASYVRWIRSPADLDEAVGFYAERCDHVRVMPFLEGLPCSIHAFVAADGVAVFRPCEMLVFRRPQSSSFQYAAAASTWECDPTHSHAMRALAQRLAAHLDSTLGYRGMFTLDGVLTADGFLPTELNPRVGAAFAMLVDGLDLPFELMHFLAIDQVDLPLAPGELETLVLAHSAERRWARAGLVVPEVVPAGERYFGGGKTPESAVFKGVIGPAVSGSYLQVTPVAPVPVGPPFGPRAVQWLSEAASAFGVNLGPLVAATLPDAIQGGGEG